VARRVTLLGLIWRAPDFGRTTMSVSSEFQDVISRFRAGDEGAAGEIFRRFVVRLTALAATQFDAGRRSRADPEGVVQSVYRSFFTRDLKTPFQLDGWEGLWSLLAVITIRKCARKRATEPVTIDQDFLEAVDRQPTPDEALALNDLIARIFQTVDPDDRTKADLILQGFTAVEIASRCNCSERTIRRLRDFIRAKVEAMLSDACNE
jgi:RNA polymerase sigma-70 factor, ECF subfamily